MKIGFYVSRKATRLKKFLNHINLNYQDLFEHIDFVLTDNLEDHELELLCLNLKIDFFFLNNEGIKAKNLFSSDYVLKLLEEKGSDYLFIYCDIIIRGTIFEKYKNRIINFHPSILPAHQGLLAIDQALKSNTFLLGNTAHYVDEGIDTGPVIMQSILPRQNYINYDQVLDMQIPMLVQLFYWFKANRIKVNDKHIVVKDASYNVDTFIPNLEININQLDESKIS